MGKMFFSFVLSVLFAGPVFSQAMDSIIHNQYVSPRALGMGNALIAGANDAAALFYNPAALARVEDGHVNMAFEGSGSSSFFTFFGDLISTASGDYATPVDEMNAISNFLASKYGETFTGRGKFFEATWLRPYWGFGFIPLDMTLKMQVQNSGVPGMEIKTYADTTLAYGRGWYIEGVRGILTWGVTGKFINRGYISRAFTVADLAANDQIVRNEDMTEGYTLDADIGFQYSPYIPDDGIISAFQYAKPTFALVLRNIADWGFKNSLKLYNQNATGEPEKLNRVLDIGSKWEYPTLGIFGGRGTLDIKNINHPAFTLNKGLHLGFEFDWTMASWWKGQYRIGLNQGYWTAGFSALFAYFRMDFATWGEEVGSTDSKREDRQILLKFNLDI